MEEAHDRGIFMFQKRIVCNKTQRITKQKTLVITIKYLSRRQGNYLKSTWEVFFFSLVFMDYWN